ncbi:MAG: M1 family aminopeptidase, partial [Myxococcota bacterium]
MIITQDEAEKAGKSRAKGQRTWKFKAENVRDFAWASSRSLMWDAMRFRKNGNDVLAMSYWPSEGEPLWSQYSTWSIVHTIDVYSRHTFAYPYPVAISVNSIVGGMEYPMICFNAPRPYEDKTYFGLKDKEITDSWRHSKYGLISVIIHEVGHNFFPMIVNSDERQWTWMDEGLNTFLQFLAEQEWEEGYPSRRGFPEKIVEYMTSEGQVPIMTNSESILQFGNNAYGKPATALNILRETVMGRELFDFAFKEYSQSWMFRRPMPADFFRSMEDASAVDLDWFWRGWFYSTDHVDIAIKDVREFILESGNPDRDKPARKRERDKKTPTITEQRNARVQKLVEKYPELKDFYNSYDELDVTKQDREAFKEMFEALTPQERGL